MVYSKVNLLLGVCITKDDLSKLEYDFDYDNLDDNFAGSKLELDENITLYKFPCCSDIGEEKFILGTEINSYDRTNDKCDECEEYYACENCLGATTNGWYDVEDILHNPVICDAKYVCTVCDHDNHTDSELCSFCSNNRKDQTISMNDAFEEIQTFLKEVGIDGKTQYYYMLDDCLSCT
jgi:hypothetical protein